MTREEAIQILSTRDAHGVLCGYTSGATEALDMAIEALQTDATDVTVEYDVEYLPDKDGIHQAKATITKANVMQGWIPCSERLPSEHGKYLVFYNGILIGSNIEIMWYGEPLMPNVQVSGKHFYRTDSEWGDIIYDEVIAWMPLPNAPIA